MQASEEDADEEPLLLSQHIQTRFHRAFLAEEEEEKQSVTETEGEEGSGDGIKSVSSLLKSLPPVHFDQELHRQIRGGTGSVGADAYWSLSGISRIQLPTIYEWSTVMKKAYTLLFWIRPRIDVDSGAPDQDVIASNLQGCLYKFAHDSNSSGIIVYVNSEWTQLDVSSSEEDGRSGGSVARRIQTTLTALSSVSVLQLPLTLTLNEWHLVGCTHIFPYLKRPQFTLTVNGNVVGTGELEYPNNLQIANDNVVLQNICCGGLLVPTTPSKSNNHNNGNDTVAKDADKSEATVTEQVGSTNAASSLTEPVNTVVNRRSLVTDLSSFGLYPVSVSPTIQSLLFEAGPTSVINGRMLPLIPAVANWNKGSSIEAGPKVGIPLIVHGVAPEIQQLATTVVMCFDAVHSTLLDESRSGAASSKTAGRATVNRRFMCPMIPQAGWSEKSPRVGLMQPGPPVRYEEQSYHGEVGGGTAGGSIGDGPPQCYVTGTVAFRQSLLDYCKQQGIVVRRKKRSIRNQDKNSAAIEEYDTSTLYWSVAMEDVVHYTVLPFFLALCPQGKFVEKDQGNLYSYSVSRMFRLYSNNAVLASSCIDLLATWIENGGPRVAESVLQNGYLHILPCCLRASLLRAQKAKFFTDDPKTEQDWIRRFKRTVDESTILSSATAPTPVASSPKAIPPLVSKACARLVAACCGPATSTAMTDRTNGELPMWLIIRRTSDLALTGLFSLALDADLWNLDANAASLMYRTVADRYWDSGYVLRSQISVQFFLDCTVKRQLQYNEDVGEHLSRLLTAMLLASLSNKRSISQGEHDVEACVGALSDCPLSSLAAHVVLHALTNVLAWCEVLPESVSSSSLSFTAVTNSKADEQAKMQVASRLGRNLLSSQFHDVVAPMLLSRTVFSGESSAAPPQQQEDSNDRSTEIPGLSWESHWRLALLLFSWVASIAGPEGVIASKASGSLMLASSLAGSLAGAMDDVETDMISLLFLPPPGMALMIGSTIRNEWSYTDLIAGRLQIMMPLLPGLVLSLLSSHQLQQGPGKLNKPLTSLAELLDSVGGAFHKVFGGTIHRRDGSSDGLKAAKSFVPHLIVAAVAIERRLVDTDAPNSGGDAVIVYKPEVARNKLKGVDRYSWVDVPSSSDESGIGDLSSALANSAIEPDASTSGSRAVARVLKSCQKTVLNTSAGLLSNAMILGGAGAALSLWTSVLSSLEEATSYISSNANEDLEGSKQAVVGRPIQQTKEARTCISDPSSQGSMKDRVLCRLISIVLIKSLKRQDQWEVWSYELSSSVAKVCQLVEEKELLRELPGSRSGGVRCLNDDQILLLSAILEILSYGRDATGWCQLALPAMSNSFSEISGGKPPSDLSAASKLLLPVLQSCLRLVMASVANVASSLMIKFQGGESADDGLCTESLLQTILRELDLTLTAAIVGLSFSGARDIALGSMATFRSAASRHEEAGDVAAAADCKALVVKIAEELRARYEGERRLREQALFDAYDNDANEAAKDAVEGANVVERLILGGDVLGSNSDAGAEEISFDRKSPKRQSNVSDDFVLFHEPSSSQKHSEDNNARLGYAEYIGLGAALEECRVLTSSSESKDEYIEKILATLSAFLDSWDSVARTDDKESEVVAMFSSEFQLRSGSNDSMDTYEGHKVAVAGSETAADSMSAFFEFAAAEKARSKEFSYRFLPSHRYSRMSYSERFCWARFTEVTYTDIDVIWERGMPDGNRDVRSRLPTLPCSPQFRRYIPKYLDHYAEPDEVEENSKQQSEQETRRSSVPGDVDAFTRSLLEAGNLEIVDITKKETPDEEDEPELSIRAPTGSIDEDDAALFTDAVSDVESNQYGKNDADADSGGDIGGGHFAGGDDAPPSEDFGPSHFDESSSALLNDVGGKGQHSITTSAFSTPPDNASSSLGLLHSAAAGMIEHHVDNCLHVKAEGSRPCTVLLTATHLVLEYEGDPEGFFEGEVLAAKEDADRQRMIKEAGEYKETGPDEVYQQKLERRQREIAALRPKSIRWNLSEVSHVYLRRYRLRDSSIEVFFIPTGGAAYGGYGLFSPSTSLFLDFGPGHDGNRRRDDAAFAIMQRVPQQAIKQWPDRSAQFLHDQLSRLSMGWVEGRITNFDYLLHLNMLAGRSYNDVCQYPVFPWVLADYSSENVPDLTDPKNFRDLSKPVGALNPNRLEEFIERFNTFADPSIPPFYYGSHYSTSAGVVLHFLVRLHPFAGLHRQLQR